MGEIPEHIRSEARKAIYDTGRGMIGRERNYLEYRVSRALLAAEKRGREEERERVRKIARLYGTTPLDPPPDWTNEERKFFEAGQIDACSAIEVAIRSGQ